MSGGSKIFIGNIPYGVTDETIIDILGRAGQVINFRAMTDKETGKPKGYGFAEFTDADAAYSAVRNLNDYELQGRKLRVDYANEKEQKEAAHAMTASAPSIPPSIDGQATQNRLPPLPPGVDLPAGIKAEDAISKTLQTLPVSQLLDLLVTMQNLVHSDPVQAQQLLDSAPQLSYAIFQALLNLNLVDPATLTSVIQQASAPGQTPAPAYQAPAAAPQPPVPAPYGSTPQYGSQYPPPQPPQPPYQTGTPVAQPYGAPQPPQAPPVQDSNREALIQQVPAMPQDQIDALPPTQRQQIIALRQQLQQQYR